MQRFQVRRLPVVSAEGTLQGVVSMNDLVLASQRRDGPSAAAVVGAMAAICAHRDPLAIATEVAA
jgi:CBS domain-containing protein